MRIFISAVLACVVAGQAHAGNCVKQAVVQQQIVTPIVPLIQAVQIPLYSYQYSPPAYTMPQPMPQQPVQAPQTQALETGDCCQQLVAELAKLRAEIAALRGGVPIPAAPPPGVVGSVLSNRCAACHGAVEPKGEFSLFLANGKRSPLSIQQQARVKRRVVDDSMPKPAPGAPHQPLTQAEKDQLFRELETP